MAALQNLPWLCMIFAVAAAAPTPGRIPKVYNALITSNQNLEPSKAFPVYQPVLHNTFPFPLQTVVYGDLPLSNGLIPPPPVTVSKDANSKPEETPSPAPEASETDPAEKPSPSPSPPPSPEPKPESENGSSSAPPPEPKTESPIPLNEFGLPPQVLPLGHGNPTYHYTPFTSYPYAYPGLRLYDPYDPFGFHAYSGWPLYQPLTNVLGPTLSLQPQIKPEAPAVSPSVEDKPAEAPPSEPSDLNVLNYAAKDPAIPNVPPPPLPQGGLKSDKE